jgi:hypothetical protein
MTNRIEFYDRATAEKVVDLIELNDFLLLESGVYCHIDDVCEVNGGLYHADDCVICSNGMPELYEDTSSCDSCGDSFSVHSDECYQQGGHDFCDDECMRDAGYEMDEYGELIHESDRPSNELRPYSDTCEKMESVDKSHPFRIGFEVEKEDLEVLGELDQNELREWIAVSDGSLSSDAGFELVSPAYNLTSPNSTMEVDIRSNALSKYLNADSDQNCGGHITISERSTNGDALLARINDAIPLLYAMFRGRLKNTFSPCKGGKQCSGEKYQAIVNKGNRLEFRLPSRVKSSDQLLRRIRLFRYILSYRTRNTVAFDLADQKSELRALLSEMYSTDETKVNRIIELYPHFQNYWNDGLISSNIVDMVPSP